MSGYHAVAVKGRHDPADVIRAVYGVRTGEPVEAAGTGEFPSDGAQPATAVAGQVEGWTVVCGDFPPDMNDDAETARLAELSRGGTAARWATESASGALALDLFAGGQHQRHFFLVEGEVEGSTGEPLQGEPSGGLHETDPFELDEWTLVEVVEAHVAPWDAIAQAEYTRFRFQP
ncbi:MAG TPA: hypothetical protein VHG08_07015 [Longimicrobium sp.]|nr:hypothetical protein [Longimicrobium sp.]